MRGGRDRDRTCDPVDPFRQDLNDAGFVEGIKSAPASSRSDPRDPGRAKPARLCMRLVERLVRYCAPMLPGVSAQEDYEPFIGPAEAPISPSDSYFLSKANWGYCIIRPMEQRRFPWPSTTTMNTGPSSPRRSCASARWRRS